MEENKLTYEQLEEKVEQLEFQQQLFLKLLESSPMYIFFKDKDIRSVLLSHNYEEMLKMPIHELLGKSMDDLFPSDLAKSMIADDKAVLEHDKLVEVIEELNNRIYYTVKFPVTLDNGSKYLAGFTIDQTESIHNEECLKLREKEQKDLNETKDKILSIIGHDLKSPMNSIIGFSELLVRSIQCQEMAKSLRYLEIINTSAKSTMQLLDNLLYWAKAQTGQIVYNPMQFGLSSVFHEITDMFESIARIKNITLSSYLPYEIDVYTDKNMLRTILRNLVSNAIKFTKTEGMVDIYATLNEKTVEITVADNGIGISPETMEKLFKQDASISTSGTENEKGSGIGLLLCKEFIEMQGGKIWIESNIGKGCNVKFTIPAITS